MRFGHFPKRGSSQWCPTVKSWLLITKNELTRSGNLMQVQINKKKKKHIKRKVEMTFWLNKDEAVNYIFTWKMTVMTYTCLIRAMCSASLFIFLKILWNSHILCLYPIAGKKKRKFSEANTLGLAPWSCDSQISFASTLIT